MGNIKGLQDSDILKKLDEFNSSNKLFARIIIIRESLAEQMAELIQSKQGDKVDALGDIYLNVIYGKANYGQYQVFVSSLADSVDGGILIG